MNGGATVYVIDSDAESRHSICEIVESMELFAQPYSGGEPFLEECRAACYGCVVARRSAEDPMGFTDLITNMNRFKIALPTIVLVEHPQTSVTVELMKHGAVTVLEHPFQAEELRDAVNEAIEISRTEHSKHVERQIVLDRIASLSDGEVKVMDLVIRGLANKVIANRLSVSIRTVEGRRQKVLAKMQVNSVAELVRIVVSSSGPPAP